MKIDEKVGEKIGHYLVKSERFRCHTARLLKSQCFHSFKDIQLMYPIFQDTLGFNLSVHHSILFTNKASLPRDKIRKNMFSRPPEWRQYSFVGAY